MGKLWAIIKREYLERIRSKWVLIGTFLGRVFFGAIIIIPAYIAAKSKAGTEVYDTVVIDVTKSNFGKRVVDAITGGGQPGSTTAISLARPSLRPVDPSQ